MLVLLLLSVLPFHQVFSVDDTFVGRSFSQETWLRKLVNDQQYDRFIQPGYFTDQSSSQITEVKIMLYVESIGNYKAGTMDYDLDIYFREFWTDLRLIHNQSMIVINDRKLIDLLWRPDIYFANSKQAAYNDVTLPNCVFRIGSNGSIQYSVRISLKLSCHMDLKAYPIDHQECFVKMLSYASPENVMLVDWKIGNASVQVNPEIVESDLRLVGNYTKYCTGIYYGEKYSCLLVEFALQRDLGSSLFQIYLPSTFIVIISWISFWIDPSSVPGRVGLSITTLLTLSTQSAGIRLQLPPVSYAKALDVWLGVCLIAVFGVLVEFAVVNMFSRLANNPLNTKPTKPTKNKDAKSSCAKNITLDDNEIVKDSNATVISKLLDLNANDEEVDLESLSNMYRYRAYMVDYISRVAFPATFFLFSLIYWITYLYLV